MAVGSHQASGALEAVIEYSALRAGLLRVRPVKKSGFGDYYLTILTMA